MPIAFVEDEFGLLHARVPHHTLVNAKMQVMALEGDDGWWVYLDGERVPGAFRTLGQAGSAAEAEIARQKQSTDWLQRNLEAQRMKERAAAERMALERPASMRSQPNTRPTQRPVGRAKSVDGRRALILSVFAVVFVAVGFGAGHAVGVFERADKATTTQRAHEAGSEQGGDALRSEVRQVTIAQRGTVQETALVLTPRIPVPPTVRDLRIRVAAVRPTSAMSTTDDAVHDVAASDAPDVVTEDDVAPTVLSSTSALEAVQEEHDTSIASHDAVDVDEEVGLERENAALATDDDSLIDEHEDTRAGGPTTSTQPAPVATRQATKPVRRARPSSSAKRRAAQRQIERRAARRAATRRARAARRNRLVAKRRKARRRAGLRRARARRRAPRKYSRAAIRRAKARRVKRTYKKAFRDTLD
ncbi:MAG: hypothetical protein AAFZ01_03040 [Pseudomonadota bacterium]